MKIIYEDTDIIVAYKPANMLTQSDAEGNKGLLEELSDFYKQPIYLIHRLDYGVSGLLVFARNSKMAAELSKIVGEHDFVKEYYALVHGVPEEQGIFEDFIYKDNRKMKAFVVKKERKGVKKAKLEYRLVESHNDISLVHIHLYTGRFHQIRVQFASRGYPLVGDGKYGAKDNEKRLALCAYHLAFIHPRNKKPLDFEIDIKEEEIFNNKLFD